MQNMTIYNFGDILLVPFPFTDQTTTKKRPTIVISSDIAIVSFRRQTSKLIAQSDAQIAAIALSKNAVLATQNIADFCDCHLTLVNSWKF